MNNWSLLLLALVAFFQPIPIFTECNVFDGRQCCDHQQHTFLRAPNTFTDDSFRFDKATTEERRINRNAAREINQFERKLNRQSSERIRRPILNSPTRSRIQNRVEKINSDNKRRERQFSRRNYRNTRHELDFLRLNLDHNERARNNINRRHVNNRNEIRWTDPLGTTRVVPNRGGNRISRSESKDRDIVRRITRHVVSADRRTFLRDETRVTKLLIIDRRSRENLIETRRSRENVIETRRSVLLPNTGVNKKIRDNRNTAHNSLRVSIDQRQRTVRYIESRQQTNENRVSRYTSVRRNLHERMSTQSAQRYSEIHRTTNYRSDRISMIRNYDSNTIRYNTVSEIQKRLERRQGTNRVVSRRTDRELFITQDGELRHRTRSTTRRDYRDLGPIEKTIRSTESTKDLRRTKDKHDTERERENVHFRNLKVDRIRENLNSYQKQEQIKNQTNRTLLNILYTLQGIYLCGLFMQIIIGDEYGKPKSRNLRWWSPFSTSLIKVE